MGLAELMTFWIVVLFYYDAMVPHMEFQVFYNKTLACDHMAVYRDSTDILLRLKDGEVTEDICTWGDILRGLYD